MEYVLGIDIGTSVVKTVLYSSKGEIVRKSYRAYDTRHPQPGWVEQDPDDWYAAVVSSIKDLINKLSISPKQISSVGFSGHIRSIAFVDRDFNVVYPGIVWSDTRSRQIVSRISQKDRKRLVKITGNRAATNFSLSHILWMKENHPSILDNTRYFVAPKDYVIYRLTGKLASDASTQSGSLLIDSSTKDWSDQLLADFDIPRDSLPELLQSTDVVGHITDRASKDCGLPVGTPVVLGGGDNDCAAIGSGAYLLGTVSISLGTASIVLTRIDQPAKVKAGNLDLFSHVIPNKWYAMGMVISAGFALKWLKERLNDERESLLEKKIMSMEDWLESTLGISEGLVPGSDGLFCFPYYQGRGNPDKNPNATGVFLGLTGGHSNRHLLQASMEGVGYCIKQCVNAISELTIVKDFVCSGQGSTNSIWMNIITNILGKPIWVRKNIEEGALGAAILAATGIGIHDTVMNACEIMTKRDVQYLPDNEKVFAYEKHFNSFCTISDNLWPQKVKV